MARRSLPRTVLASAASCAVGLALVGSATGAAAAGSGPGSLAGTWTSVDGDGSHQTLQISGSGTRVYSMLYTDDAATGACGGDPARLSGPGYVDGDHVVMVAVLVCLPGGNVVKERLAIGFHHDDATDTLVDDFGIAWERAG